MIIINYTRRVNNIRWYGDVDLTDLLSNGNYYSSRTTMPGMYQYFPTQTLSGCESPPDTFTQTINPLPDAPVSEDVIYCEGETIMDLHAVGSINQTVIDYDITH
jgi:hypothetical protein